MAQATSEITPLAQTLEKLNEILLNAKEQINALVESASSSIAIYEQLAKLESQLPDSILGLGVNLDILEPTLKPFREYCDEVKAKIQLQIIEELKQIYLQNISNLKEIPRDQRLPYLKLLQANFLERITKYKLDMQLGPVQDLLKKMATDQELYQKGATAPAHLQVPPPVEETEIKDTKIKKTLIDSNEWKALISPIIDAVGSKTSVELLELLDQLEIKCKNRILTLEQSRELNTLKEIVETQNLSTLARSTTSSAVSSSTTSTSESNNHSFAVFNINQELTSKPADIEDEVASDDEEELKSALDLSVFLNNKNSSETDSKHQTTDVEDIVSDSDDEEEIVKAKALSLAAPKIFSAKDCRALCAKAGDIFFPIWVNGYPSTSQELKSTLERISDLLKTINEKIELHESELNSDQVQSLVDSGFNLKEVYLKCQELLRKNTYSMGTNPSGFHVQRPEIFLLEIPL
ncbi:MAG TPA: hypothetical protein VHE99_05825 [Gammaproteobacteria bacterium]|nr:hypothetical protein [Gammaproteobacteria bacterium]